MRKEILNGIPIPYDAPLEKLQGMLSSPLMQDFSLACEALSYKNDPRAYEILRSHLQNTDKYRRLYVLKVIFRYPQAAELANELEAAIASDDFLMIENGLIIVSEYHVKVSESLLLRAVRMHCDRLYTAVGALKMLAVNDQNFAEITSIFAACSKCAQKEILGEILCGYLPQRSVELFALFKADSFAKIRRLGLEIGKAYGFDTSDFLSDTDGHIRKSAQ